MAGESTRVLDRGDDAPAFSLPGVDGETYDLDDFADAEALLVVFTCNHCPYAQAKHPALNAIAADYDDIAVVGINPNDADAYPADSMAGMREEVESGRIDYDAYLRDESQSVAAAYGAVCTPDPYLFARRGDAFELVYHGRLDDALNPDADPSGEPGFEMREVIDAVLAGEDVDTPFRPSRGCTIKWRDGNEPDYWGER